MPENKFKVSATVNATTWNVPYTGRFEAGNHMATYYPRAFAKLKHPEEKPEPNLKDGPAGRRVMILGVYHRSGHDHHPTDRHPDLHSVGYYNIKELLAKFFLNIYNRRQVSNWRNCCISAASGLHDNPNHMPLLDYDGKNIKKMVQEDIGNLQAKFGLGPAWLYRTRRGYHVYFGSDQKDLPTYIQILEASRCCSYFLQHVKRDGMGNLRVSAKYTDFDIEYEGMIPGPNQAQPRRKTPEMLIIEQLIKLGSQCNTHLASLYPQWAPYTEDPAPWKPRAQKRMVRGEGRGEAPPPWIKNYFEDKYYSLRDGRDGAAPEQPADIPLPTSAVAANAAKAAAEFHQMMEEWEEKKAALDAAANPGEPSPAAQAQAPDSWTWTKSAPWRTGVINLMEERVHGEIGPYAAKEVFEDLCASYVPMPLHGQLQKEFDFAMNVPFPEVVEYGHHIASVATRQAIYYRIGWTGAPMAAAELGEALKTYEGAVDIAAVTTKFRQELWSMGMYPLFWLPSA